VLDQLGRLVDVEPGNIITRWVDVDRGGHFAALEEPEALTADVREFFRGLR
jgi:pimeloyl-ACP methyl ester carboxylesterase